MDIGTGLNTSTPPRTGAPPVSQPDTDSAIGTEQQPGCVACAGAGRLKYDDLTDRLFGVAGNWTMYQCQARHCRALWLNPRPTPQEVWKAYRHYYTHGADDLESLVKRTIRFLSHARAASRFGGHTGRLPWPGSHLVMLLARLYPGLVDHVDLMIRYQSPPARGQEQRLLDVGCGDGEALLILRELGWKVQGVEFDPSAVAAAGRRGIDVHQGDLASAACQTGTFHLVSSTHVLEHVHDPLGFLRESHRVLAPGGRIVTVTPNAEADGHLRHGRHWRGLEPPRHIGIYTEPALRAMAARAGFQDIRIFTTARAVGLAETAAILQRDTTGVLAGQAAPSGSVRLRAHWAQLRASLRKAVGALEGEELVMLARK
jgi:SAM-dependent methyltransferase